MKRCLILATLLFLIVGCNRTGLDKDNISQIDNETCDEAIALYKENLNQYVIEKENYRKLYIDAVHELERFKDSITIYRLASETITEKNSIENEVLRKIYELSCYIGDTPIEKNNCVNHKDLLRVNLSYNIVTDSLKNEFKKYFGKKFIEINVEQMIDIKTDLNYKIIPYVIGDFQGVYIEFKNIQPPDEISIEMNDDFKNIAGFDFDTIKINVK